MNDKLLRYRGEADCEPLHYTACGLDDVYLLSGYDRVETAYGVGVSVKDVDALHRVIARHLVFDKKALNGKEIRFLRKQMDWSQEELAQMLSVNVQSVARWEKGEHEPPGPAESMIRLLYLDAIGAFPHGLNTFLAQLAAKDDHQPDRQCYAKTNGEWVPRAA